MCQAPGGPLPKGVFVLEVTVLSLTILCPNSAAGSLSSITSLLSFPDPALPSRHPETSGSSQAWRSLSPLQPEVFLALGPSVCGQVPGLAFA